MYVHIADDEDDRGSFYIIVGYFLRHPAQLPFAWTVSVVGCSRNIAPKNRKWRRPPLNEEEGNGKAFIIPKVFFRQKNAMRFYDCVCL